MTDQAVEQRGTNVLVGLGAALLLGIVTLRCLVAISPDPTFDIDPIQDPLPWFGIGPGVSLLLSSLLLLGTFFIFLGERLSGRGIDRLLLLLAVVPLVAVVVHGVQNASDLWRGADWLAAAVAAVGFAHAARAPGMRALILGGLLGMVTLLAVRGGVQFLFEHTQTVAMFDANKEVVLRSFGWEPGSIQAELYERRLRQPEATGWFGLANIFSAFMAIACVAALTTAGSLPFRDQDSSGIRGVLYLVALGCGLLVLANGSKGAIGALVLGFVVTGVSLIVPGIRKHSSRGFVVGFLALCALGFVFFVVFVRGILGEASLGGETSLLFRWQYLLGALRITFAYPIFGVGPDGFQSAYVLLKNAWSPEDPTSAHNAILDWIATLGVFGCAWVLLLLLSAFRSAKSVFVSSDGQPPSALLFILALVVASLFGVLYEFGTLSAPLLLLRVCGVILAVVVLYATVGVCSRLPDYAVSWSFGSIATTILVLSALDMLFVQPGSVAAAWAFLGAITVAKGVQRRFFDFGAVSLPAFLALWFYFFAALPQLQVDVRMEQAAEPLRTLGRVYANSRRDATGSLAPMTRADAIGKVQALTSTEPGFVAFDEPDWETLAPGSNDSRVIAGALLRALAPSARRAAVDQLEETWDLYPTNFSPAWATVAQLRLLAQETPAPDNDAILFEALVRSDHLMQRTPGPRAAITAAWILNQSAEVQQDPDWAAVMEGFERAIEFSPHDPALWRGLAFAAREAGDTQREQAALEQALISNERRHLDPLVQFSAEEQQDLESRLNELAGQPSE